jgi:hypothetical protein
LLCKVTVYYIKGKNKNLKKDKTKENMGERISFCEIFFANSGNISNFAPKCLV